MHVSDHAWRLRSSFDCVLHARGTWAAEAIHFRSGARIESADKRVHPFATSKRFQDSFHRSPGCRPKHSAPVQYSVTCPITRHRQLKSLRDVIQPL